MAVGDGNPDPAASTGGPGHRLGVFWFLYMAGLGIFFPWFSLYLSDGLGLPPRRVGIVAATLPLVGLVAQPFWAWLADRTGSRRRVLVLVTVGTATTTLLLGVARGFPGVWFAAACVAVFWTVVVPQATAVTLAFRSIDRFPRIRVWGTVGFLAGVLAFPPVLEVLKTVRGPFSGLGWMFPTVAAVTLAAGVAAATLPEAGAVGVRARPGEWRSLWSRPPLVRLAVVAFLVHALGHGPIVLLPLLVAEKGGGVADVGSMWVAMLLVEIPLIAGAGRVLRRLGPRGLLRLGLWAEGLRWAVAALAPNLAVLQGAMLLHGLAVTGILVGIPLYAERCAGEGLRSSAQAMASVVGLGLGAVVSDAVAGLAVDRWGAAGPFGVAGAGVLLLACLLPRWLPEASAVE